jgi:protocatechuate 4,5-dioxygenase alpha chain
MTMALQDAELQAKLGPRVALTGLRPMTTERAQRGYRLSRFLTSMREPAQRARFGQDEAACMQDFGLTDAEQQLVLARDYNAMLDYGASVVAIGKALGALGSNLVARGALGMGLSTEEFIRQRKSANKGYPWEF